MDFQTLALNLGFVPLTIEHPQLNASLEWFRGTAALQVAKARPGHAIHTGYLQDLKPDAFAANIADHDLIALNFGAFWFAHKVASSLKRDLRIPWLRSSENARMLAVTHTYRYLVGHIFLHELGHVLLGHAGYARSKFGLRYIGEAEMRSTNSPIDPFTRQALEFDADGYAILLLMKNLPKSDPGADSRWLKPRFDEQYGRNSGILLSALLVIYLFLRVFDDFHQVGDGELSHHPRPSVRRFVTLLRATQAMHTDNAIELDLAMSMTALVAKVGEELHALENGFALNPQSIVDAGSAAGIEYLHGLNATLETLRPNLEPFARI
jgi:hypothetical protein